LIPGILLLSCIQSCKPNVGQGSKGADFFDLKGYFEGEVGHLKKLNPLITKTVVYNASTETKKVHITNWETELSMFIESDINKPACIANYKVQKSGDFLIYKATDKDSTLKTRDIIIKKSGDKIKWILIFNNTNPKKSRLQLYETVEKLSYFPDSLYSIVKIQRVKLMGTDKYTIRGSFN